MKTTLFIVLGALALGTVGCASRTDDGESSVAEEADGETGERSDALRIGGGGGLPDRDTCEATKAGCYTSCKGKDSSCYRYCDIVYAQCRGLPPPAIGMAAARE